MDVPKAMQEALSVPEWKNVVQEMNALNKIETWEIMQLPDGKRTVGCRWVFTLKLNSDGSLECYKFVAGFYTDMWIDYQETFAPVAKLNSIKNIVVVNLDWPLYQMDVKMPS